MSLRTGGHDHYHYHCLNWVQIGVKLNLIITCIKHFEVTAKFL